MMKVIRAVVSGVKEGAIKIFSGTGRIRETFSKREYMQHYGFTSRPLQGGEAILLKDGNVVYVIGSDDRRYRIALQEGEVALYTDEGDKVHLKRGGNIEITAGTKITLNAPAVELGDGTLYKLIDERFKTLYDGHTHSGVTAGAGVTGAPVVPLDLSTNATTKTKGS